MSFQISYAAVCFTGQVRTNNEDNFCINGQYRLPTEADSDQVRKGHASGDSRPFFAVFDGMGGESCGEMASYTAAVSCGQVMRRSPSMKERLFPAAFVRKNCYEMNHAVCAYAAEHKIRSMGTTAAMLYFAGNKVIFANVGDSRIYRFSGTGKLELLSKDHVEKSVHSRKGPLTQFLGLPETEVLIDPYVEEERLKSGTKYLLCSDGITDVLNDQELVRILSSSRSLTDALEMMSNEILSLGAIDNATVILCEVLERIAADE